MCGKFDKNVESRYKELKKLYGDIIDMRIPKTKLKDVYGLDSQKDTFFKFAIVPLLKPEIFIQRYAYKVVYIENGLNKGIGHFLRANAGEYSVRLITVNVERAVEKDKIAIWDKIFKFAELAQPSIVYFRHVSSDNTQYGNYRALGEICENMSEKRICFILSCISGVPEFKHLTSLSFPVPPKELVSFAFKTFLDELPNEISVEIVEAHVESLSIPDFKNLRDICRMVQYTRIFRANCFKLVDEEGDEVDSDEEDIYYVPCKSSEGGISISNPFDIPTDRIQLPPITDGDFTEAIKIYTETRLSPKEIQVLDI